MSDAVRHVRIAALDALGEIGGKQALQALLACARERDEDICAAALRALGSMRAADAVPVLLEAMAMPAVKVRLAAVAGLSRHGMAPGIASLAWAAGADGDATVADAAMRALGELAERHRGAAVDALLELLADPRRTEAASTALGRLGPSRTADIARGLRHPNTDVRCRTIDVLARLRTTEAIALVARALDDECAPVREGAALALGQLPLPDCPARLRECAQHDPSKAVRRAAASAAAPFPFE
jgi:HEAT repeat protein